ncbi:uncharacterized protein LOC141714794 [Apium graveolens]|uniref:uncharacterized protein LOC141714794 n=1 Tax=Apium graveolens TaxID=4045 RepID=UPI003D78BD46
MDKSWIFKDRDTLDYEIGVEEFLIFAEENAIKIIRGHLYENGFSLGYLNWIWHRQGSASRTSVNSNAPTPASTPAPAPTSARALIPSPGLASETVNICDAAYNSSEYNNELYQFRRFVADVEHPLYEGSECTKLESMLKLHNWKARFGISDSAFNDLLSTIGSLLPKDNVMPPNAYEAKKTLSDLGLEYIKYHSCPNNCILYWGVNVDASECPKYRLSRWKLEKDGKVRINVPAKVMWYFPIIPRFKRMFRSPSTSELMTWHSKQRIEDGKMRHPTDSPSWRNIDYRWPAFGSDTRNIRLELSADVSGPHEPGNDVDVYLQPLIDDLKLWEEGEPNVYDAYTKSYFTLKAILLWTINGFPAYGNLSGCVNKGYMCYPVCADDTVANKVVDILKLDKLQSNSIVTLCELEKILPASFFDIMIHLIVHLVRDLRLCGPVFYRWMYAFERFNKVLKSYVRNRYYPKGCIAECYLGEESVEFCHEFVKQACTTAGLRKDEGKLSGPLSVVTMKSIEEKERDEAHLHVLLNNVEEYLEGIHQGKKKSVHWLLREHNRLFADWFLEKVSSEMVEIPGGVSETIRWIAGKPSFSVLTYEAYLVDGV